MKISTKTRYGSRAMVELAGVYPSGAVSLKEVAQRQRLSVKYLEHIIAPLKAAGLVRAVRGVNGGYELAWPPEEITLEEIYEAIEGPPVVVDCVGESGACAMASGCPTRRIWVEVNDSIKVILSGTTLKGLLERSAKAEGRSLETYCI